MKYTALEIDRMRTALSQRYWQQHHWGWGSGGPPESAIQAGRATVERELLTYMANETTADELETLFEQQRQERVEREGVERARLLAEHDARLAALPPRRDDEPMFDEPELDPSLTLPSRARARWLPFRRR